MNFFFSLIFFSYLKLSSSFSSSSSYNNNNNYYCSSSSSSLNSNINNIILYSATGRIGSTNILSMFQGQSTSPPSPPSNDNDNNLNIQNLGEIFLSAHFQSLKLEPNNQSPLKYPANQEHKQKIIHYIRNTFYNSNKQQEQEQNKLHYIASIKFYHAWENGVTVKWLSKILINYGCVTHFILVTRNPVRITVSEQYGHKYNSWAYENVQLKHKNSLTSSSSPVCEKSYLAYHIGGRWMSQMAVTHFNSFFEILSLFPYESTNDIYSFSTPIYSSSISILGLSYESDILISPTSAYQKIIKFLLESPSYISIDSSTSSSSSLASSSSLSSVDPSIHPPKIPNLSNSTLTPLRTLKKIASTTSSTRSSSLLSLSLPRSNYKKGMTCLLSHILVNYEELLCTFIRYDQNHSTNPLIWMTTNNDKNNQNITYTIMMKSWYELSNSNEFRRFGYLEECSLNDILQTTYHPSLYHNYNEINYLNKYLQIIQQFSKDEKIYSTNSRMNGYCSVGGYTSLCRPEGITAIPSDKLEFCHLSLYRSKCNIMTIRNQKCYFHRNITENSISITQSNIPRNFVGKNKDSYRTILCDENSYTINRVDSITNL